MGRINLRDLVEECRNADPFLVTSHTGPVGRSVGSMLALWHFLNALGQPVVTCPSKDPLPSVSNWVPGPVATLAVGTVRAPRD